MVIKNHVIKTVPYALLVWTLDGSRQLHAPGSLSTREVMQQGNTAHYFLKPVGDRNVRCTETCFQTR